MKGIIDINIKHKDGSTEIRHEHNVVFDIPALLLKKSFEHPEISRAFDTQYAYDTGAYNLSGYFKYFGLSEDTMNLESPEFRPIALNGKSSSATNWWESVPTITKNDKSLIVQSTWTVSQALTLKSIGFLDNDYPGRSILKFLSDATNDRFAYVMDGKLYMPYFNSSLNGCNIADLKLSNFKFTNPCMGGLLNSEPPVQSTIPYKLANSDERAAYTNTTFKLSTTQYPRSGSGYARLCIFNKTNLSTPLRYFDLSQFSGIYKPSDSSYNKSLRIMNTGTKNYLLQFYSSGGTMVSNAWQIPDEPIAEDASIPLVSSNFMNGVWPSGYLSSAPSSRVVGNYVLFYDTRSGIDSWLCVRINDDLTVYAYKGLASKMANFEIYYGELCHLSLEDSGLELYSDGVGSYPSYMRERYRIHNKTAANFSTPIVLAEGDVLTVSYKIEVS